MAASVNRPRAVPAFIRPHLLQHGTCAFIVLRQPRLMALKMTYDAIFSSFDKTQTDLVAQQSHCGAHGERTYIPERIEHTRPRSQFLQALATPDEMIAFLRRGRAQRVTHATVLGR